MQRKHRTTRACTCCYDNTDDQYPGEDLKANIIVDHYLLSCHTKGCDSLSCRKVDTSKPSLVKMLSAQQQMMLVGGTICLQGK